MLYPDDPKQWGKGFPWQVFLCLAIGFLIYFLFGDLLPPVEQFGWIG
jgi:hypothetical protein